MTDDERQKLRDGNKCFYCKTEGHKAIECPAKSRTTLKVIEEDQILDGQGKANP